jgi:hypothetical protein
MPGTLMVASGPLSMRGYPPPAKVFCPFIRQAAKID